MAHQKFRAIGSVLLFTAFIAFPILNTFSGIVKDNENIENRRLFDAPEFNINYLDPFPEQFEKFYNDHFTIRTLMVNWFTYFNLRFYEKSPFPDRVVVGRNSWLYLAGGELNLYLGNSRLSNAELLAYKKDLEFQRDYLEKRGCKFYFMVTPSKATVHSENIPHTYFRINDESPGEQLINYLKKNSTVNVINIYEPFRKLRKEQQLYYKHDNHWNPVAAFSAAQIVSKHIAVDFPNLKPLLSSDYEIHQIPRRSGDIVRIIGSPEFYEGQDTDYEFLSKKTGKLIDFSHADYAQNDGQHAQLVFKNNNNHKRPKLFMISDSFSYFFFLFISECFNSSTNAFDLWQYKLFPGIIEKDPPDVYLIMAYEAFAVHVPDTRAWFKKQNIAE